MMRSRKQPTMATANERGSGVSTGNAATTMSSQNRPTGRRCVLRNVALIAAGIAGAASVGMYQPGLASFNLQLALNGIVEDDAANDQHRMGQEQIWQQQQQMDQQQVHQQQVDQPPHQSQPHLNTLPTITISHHDVVFDRLPPQSHTLCSAFIMNVTGTTCRKPPLQRASETQAGLDVVVLVTPTLRSSAQHATAPLALSMHNLFQFAKEGIRRVVFVIATDTLQSSPSITSPPAAATTTTTTTTATTPKQGQEHCDEFFDILPNHNIDHRHACIQIRMRGMQSNNDDDPSMLLEWTAFHATQLANAVPNLSDSYLVLRDTTVFLRPIQLTASHPKGNDGWMVMETRAANGFVQQMSTQSVPSAASLLSMYATHRQDNHDPADNKSNSVGGESPKYDYHGCRMQKKDYRAMASTIHGTGASGNMPAFLKWKMDAACPHPSLQRIGIWHDFHPPPWGGGNQFLLALRYGLENIWNRTVIAKSDPQGKSLINNSTDTLLANAITFKGKTTVLDRKLNSSNLALVHRIDGPYYVARYFRPLGVEDPKVPKEDRRTQGFNRKYACATVFQSQWSMDANLDIQLKLRNPIVAPNTINPTIFHPPSDSGNHSESNNNNDNDHHNSSNDFTTRKRERIRIVASSHSNNPRKGFDTMLWLDQNLNFNTYEFVYMGGIPAKGFEPRNIQLLKSGTSQDLADFLRTGDLYLAPSRGEPASNAVMEALACGLPVVYQEGSSHGDLVRDAGRGFAAADNGLLTAIDGVARDLGTYVRAIEVPSIEAVSKTYLALMRWCFHMKGLVF